MVFLVSKFPIKWQPTQAHPPETMLSVFDDIANYENYRVLGTVPNKKNAPAVKKIFEDAYCAKHVPNHENQDFETRARHRKMWAAAWLLECAEWDYEWSV